MITMHARPRQTDRRTDALMAIARVRERQSGRYQLSTAERICGKDKFKYGMERDRQWMTIGVRMMMVDVTQLMIP